VFGLYWEKAGCEELHYMKKDTEEQAITEWLRSSSEDRYNKRRYGRTILDIPEKKKKTTNQKQGVR
jgi:hypothetical protein